MQVMQVPIFPKYFCCMMTTDINPLLVRKYNQPLPRFYFFISFILMEAILLLQALAGAFNISFAFYQNCTFVFSVGFPIGAFLIAISARQSLAFRSSLYITR
jgi:hypothetical protein